MQPFFNNKWLPKVVTETLMPKINAGQILIDANVDLKVEKVDFTSQNVKSLIEETKKQQKEVLSLKIVNQEKLKLVVQLF